MAGLVPAIHVFLRGLKTWMPGTRACPGLVPGPGMTNEAWSCARLVSQRLGGDKAAWSRISRNGEKFPCVDFHRVDGPRLRTSATNRAKNSHLLVDFGATTQDDGNITQSSLPQFNNTLCNMPYKIYR